MDEQKSQQELDVQALVQRAIAEYVRQDSGRREPALKAELQEERRKREALERRLNQMAEENSRSREIADQAERSSKIRSELQTLGVTKIDLAYKAVQEDIHRNEDGRLIAKNDNGEVGIKEYLSNFVHENPEFLPARIPGGTGLTVGQRTATGKGAVDMDLISPKMSAEDRERVRQEILRVTSRDLH
jgi:FtsZ-binding cell division protein ZapB